jgi:DNA repair photolyase
MIGMDQTHARARHRPDSNPDRDPDPDLDPPAPEAAVADGLLTGPVRGRGAGLNPANRFEPIRLHILGEHLDEQACEHPGGVQVRTAVYADDARSVLNRVDSPDLPFKWTLNPYRGCEHGCIYCYARPGHEYFGLSSGLDFETKIFAKREAPGLLRRELAKRSWRGEPIVISGVTDGYQPIERELNLTRACLELLAECGQPVSIVTKNRLVTRDVDLLARLAAHGSASVAISLTTLDAGLARILEPRASSPSDRLAAMRELSSAGVPVTVMTAPIIPAINDRELPALLEAAAEAGATHAGLVLLRLPYQNKALFLEWLSRHFPDRASRVESLIRQMRGGELYDASFGTRMRGEGAYAEQIAGTFRVFAQRYGLDRPMPTLRNDRFTRPIGNANQGTLF